MDDAYVKINLESLTNSWTDIQLTRINLSVQNGYLAGLDGQKSSLI